MPPESLPCWIYKSPRQSEMYLYLASEDGFDTVPSELLALFGTPKLVIEISLHAGRKLAREDPRRVMGNLREHGFHLQMPPSRAIRNTAGLEPV